MSYKNKEQRKEYNKKWRQKHKKEKNQYNKQYNQEHKEEKKQYNKQWRQDHREQTKQYMKTRYQTDPIFKLNQTMRLVIWRSLKTNTLSKNGRHWETLVGYTIEELKLHLETQFDSYMNWENHGSYWHLDHIIPLASLTFDSEEHENFKLLWSLGNLQPLFGPENRSKHNKILINFYSLLFPFTS